MSPFCSLAQNGDTTVDTFEGPHDEAGESGIAVMWNATVGYGDMSYGTIVSAKKGEIAHST